MFEQQVEAQSSETQLPRDRNNITGLRSRAGKRSVPSEVAMSGDAQYKCRR
jgi:hypothetical protein